MAEEKVYHATVKELLGVTGPGGGLTMCRLQLCETNRYLMRVVAGPVAVDDVVTLLDCEREHRSRF
ncbi:40S ribosomal protein S28, partial [Conglomerata obtusa]